jgi:hypothetical protein
MSAPFSLLTVSSTRLHARLVAFVDTVETWGHGHQRAVAAYERVRAAMRDLEVVGPEDAAEDATVIPFPVTERPALCVMDGGPEGPA